MANQSPTLIFLLYWTWEREWVAILKFCLYGSLFQAGLSALLLSHVNSVRVRQGQTEMPEWAVPAGGVTGDHPCPPLVKTGVSAVWSVWQRQPSLTERFLLLALLFWQMKRPVCSLVRLGNYCPRPDLAVCMGSIKTNIPVSWRMAEIRCKSERYLKS